MAENRRSRNADLPKCTVDQVSLLFGRPDYTARTLTVTKSRSIKNYDSVLLGRHFDKAAALEILDHAVYAVEQDEWFANPTFEIM